MTLLGTQSPCLGCEKRVLHCRNECPEWAEYSATAEAERQARVQYAEEKRVVKNYVRERVDKRLAANRGKVHAKIDKKHR